ncbi:MAG: hypothetical protein Q9222_002826 [Ikaeria aurantiellina]
MPTKVDNLVRDCLTTPVRITVGEVGAANQDIRQLPGNGIDISGHSSSAFKLCLQQVQRKQGKPKDNGEICEH